MRRILGAMAVVLGVVSITITARYGFKLADTNIDGAIAAVMFGAIALCAFVFDAAAVRLWFTGQRKIAIFTAFIAACALVVTFANSLGGIVGRSDATIAERQKVVDARRDDEATINRLTREREAMATFVPATDDAIAAAREAVSAAERTRMAECGNGDPKQRGSNCRVRETTEQETRDKLTATLSAKAATDQAARLDAEIAMARARLDASKAVANANPLGAALELIFGTASATLTAWQAAIIAAVFELCLVGVMVAYEALGHSQLHKGAGLATHRSAAGEQNPPPEIPPRAKPKIVASEAMPTGNVPGMMANLLEPAPGKRVELEEAYRAYLSACRAQAKRAAVPERYSELLKAFCKQCRIRVVHNGKGIYLTNVKLAA